MTDFEARVFAELRELRADMAHGRAAPVMVVYLALLVAPVWVCVALAAPHETFATSPGYTVMGRLMGEAEWSYASGAAAVLCALCAAGGLWTRRLGAFLLCFWHSAVAVCIFAAAPTSIGTPPYVILAGLACSLVWRVR